MKKITTLMLFACLVACNSESKYEKTVKESNEKTNREIDSLDKASKKQLQHIEDVEQLIKAGATKEEAEKKVEEMEKELDPTK